MHHALAELALAEQAGDCLQLGWALQYASNAVVGRDIEEARNYALRSADVFEQAGDYNTLCQSMLGIGHSLHRAGRPADALLYYEQTLGIAEDPAYPMLEAAKRQLPAQVHLSMGRCLIDMGQVEKALTHLRAAVKSSASVDMPDNEAFP